MKKFHCIHCGQPINAPDKIAGSRCACPACGGVIDVPGIPKTQRMSELNTPPPVPRSRATGIWRPPGMNYYVSCPQCRKITNHKNARVPTDMTCRGCNGRFTVDRVSYPFLRFFWFLLGLGFLCTISVFSYVQAKIFSMEVYAYLFGRSAESETIPMLIVWAGGAFVLLLIIVLPTAYFGMDLPRRRLRLDTISTIFGGTVTVGWMIIIPYLIAWMYIGHKKLEVERAAKELRTKVMIESLMKTQREFKFEDLSQ